MRRIFTISLLLLATASFAQIDIVKRKVTLDTLSGRSDTIYTNGYIVLRNYPDSSILFTLPNGEVGADSSKLGITTNGLAIGNVQNRQEAFGALILTGTTTTTGRSIQTIINNSTGNYPLYLFRKGEGTPESPTAVTGELGRIEWGGFDGATWWNEGGNISVEAPGLWTTTSRPTKMNFTVSDYNGSSTNAVSINPNGTVSILGDAADSTDALTVNGNIRADTLFGAVGLSDTATLDFASINASSTGDATMTVTGAAINDPVSVGFGVELHGANINVTAFVSSPNTVTVRVSNIGALPFDADPCLVKVKVFK